jgi:hypothetical protein
MTRAEYAKLICRRLYQAVNVPFRIVSLAEWFPRVAYCHPNVDSWVGAHPGDTAVRGWVTYADFGLSIRLTAHSVVRGADGQLFDITPLENELYRDSMRFIPHPGDEQSFASMMKADIFIDCCTITT